MDAQAGLSFFLGLLPVKSGFHELQPMLRINKYTITTFGLTILSKFPDLCPLGVQRARYFYCYHEKALDNIIP